MEIIALKTWDSGGRRYGLIRTGLKLTVDDEYGRALIRQKMAKLHIPDDREQPTRNIAHDRAPRQAAPPNPPGAGPARPGRAAGSAKPTSAPRRGGGKAQR